MQYYRCAAPVEKNISGVSLWNHFLPVKGWSWGCRFCGLRQLLRAVVQVCYTQAIQRYHGARTFT